ncbi:MAG: DUF4199 domain-containing protein [Flavobacteriaceae bacterium]|nr:DUF4199 domain-containing protein [Flavobacteriaceae bacterium]
MEDKSFAKGLMLNYGTILGFLLVGVTLVPYAMGQLYDPNPILGIFLGILQYFTPLVIIYLVIKKFRELNGGLLTLSEGIKTGLGTSLIAGILLAFYNFIFYKFIEPDFFVKVAEVAQAKMIETNPNMSDEQIEMAVEMIGKFSSVWMTVASAIMSSLFGGLIYSLICGLILKKSE